MPGSLRRAAAAPANSFCFSLQLPLASVDGAKQRRSRRIAIRHQLVFGVAEVIELQRQAEIPEPLTPAVLTLCYCLTFPRA